MDGFINIFFVFDLKMALKIGNFYLVACEWDEEEEVVFVKLVW